MVAIESSKTVLLDYGLKCMHNKYTNCAHLHTSGKTAVGTICFSLDLRLILQEGTQIYYYKPGKKPMGRGFVGPSGKATTIVWSNGCVCQIVF